MGQLRWQEDDHEARLADKHRREDIELWRRHERKAIQRHPHTAQMAMPPDEVLRQRRALEAQHERQRKATRRMQEQHKAEREQLREADAANKRA